MAELEIDGKSYQLDEAGFLCDPELWNEDLATQLAHAEAIPEITADHWKVLRYFRRYFAEYGNAPMLRKVCTATGLQPGELNELFPGGWARAARKLAGLPNPATSCIGTCMVCTGCANRMRASA